MKRFPERRARQARGITYTPKPNEDTTDIGMRAWSIAIRHRARKNNVEPDLVIRDFVRTLNRIYTSVDKDDIKLTGAFLAVVAYGSVFYRRAEELFRDHEGDHAKMLGEIVLIAKALSKRAMGESADGEEKEKDGNGNDPAL